MSILSNTPTLSYIYIKNMVITYNDVPYNILNIYTMKPYIFWDANDPYKLITSNTILEEKVGLYYIIFNDKGNPVMVPQTDLEISFSENGNGDLITEKIIGFQNSLDVNETRFLTIETDVDHLKTVVGGEGSSGDGSSLFEQLSKIEQDVDSINAEVNRIETEYGDNEELRTLREDTNIAILKLQSVLGVFLSDMQEFMKDNKLTDEEASQIAAYKSNMEAERAKLNLQIDNVIARLTEQNETDNVTRLTTQKNLLNDSIDNLYTNIDTACTDKEFTNIEMVTITSYFSTVGNKINETNSMIDEFIFLESGGKLIEELARLTIEQNEIKQIVSKSESDVEDVIIKLEKTIARIDTYYYSSTSKEVLEGGEWSTTAPTWVDGRFLWTKTVTVYTDETTEESDPVCITGQQGESVSSYTWIMYANDGNGNGMSNDPTDKSYIGFAYNKPTETESDDPSDYTWSRFKGEDGLNGEDGEDGTSVKILGTYETEEELNQAHPDNNNNGDGYIINGDLFVWDGDKFTNVGQIKGADGLNAYLHIKYSNDGGETFTPTEGEEVGDYMGVYTDSIEADSTDVTRYTWKKIKGEEGVPGEKGEDGKTYYTWIRYSDNPDGTNMYNTPNSSTEYIGIASNKETMTESDDPLDYTWSKFKGADGKDGVDGKDGTSVKILGSYDSVDELKQAHPDNNENGDGYIVDGNLWVWDGTEFIEVGQIKGEDGLTAYVHIKYSNDGGITFTPGNGEEMGDYMGVYTDNTEADSSNVSDYNWKKIKGEDGVPGEKGEDGKSTYTWIRYSDNENGSNMYNTPNSLTVYIGIATNKDTPTESDNPSDYMWSKFKGDDGVDGRGITSVTPQYYLSTSKEQPIDGEWIETQPTWNEDFYLWLRYEIVYNNPASTEYTTPILDETWESLKDLKDDIDNTKIQVETIKNDVAEHTVTIGDITSKVGSMESTITTITKNVEGLEGQVEENKTIITETRDTVATHTTSLDNISGRIQLVESNTTNINGELTNLESRINEAEQTLTKDGLTTIIGDSYATEAKINDIVVSKGYVTKTEVTQTTESITQSFTSSGGYNLLYNSNFKKGLTDWEINGTGANVVNGQSCLSGYAVQIIGTLNTANWIVQGISLDPNVDTYTLSWYQFTSSAGYDGITNPFRCPEITVAYTDGTIDWIVSSSQTNYDVWEKISITINKTSGKSFSHVLVELWNRDTTRTVYYSDVMFEKGSLSNVWSPNPNEIYDGISTFNKDGLRIEMQDGEGTQGYSCVSYDGFSVYDSNGDRKAWFGQDDKCYIQHLYTDDITCGRVVKKNVDMPTTFYVNATPPSGSNFSGLSVANACNSINEMINRIKENYGEYLPWQVIKILVANGVYNETVDIAGFIGGGRINIILSPSVKVYGKWRIHNNSVAIEITGGKSSSDTNNGAELILTDETYEALFHIKNSFCIISQLRSLNKCYPKSDGTKYGDCFIFLGDGGKAIMYMCDISRYYYGIYCCNASTSCIADCRGYVAISGVATYGSFLGTAIHPSGTKSMWTHMGGFINNADSTSYTSLYDPNYETTTTVTPPTPTAVSFSQSFALTNLKSVPEGTGSGTSSRTGQMGQGKWGSYKPHRGWGTIPSSLIAFCSGATNISMTITMTRLNTNHGYAGAVPAPIFVYSGGTWDSNATFSRGQTRTITLPSTIVSQIASGSMTSIQIWAGTSTNDYSFYNNVSINVTCTKYV